MAEFAIQTYGYNSSLHFLQGLLNPIIMLHWSDGCCSPFLLLVCFPHSPLGSIPGLILWLSSSHHLHLSLCLPPTNQAVGPAETVRNCACLRTATTTRGSSGSSSGSSGISSSLGGAIFISLWMRGQVVAHFFRFRFRCATACHHMHASLKTPDTI